MAVLPLAGSKLTKRVNCALFLLLPSTSSVLCTAARMRPSGKRVIPSKPRFGWRHLMIFGNPLATACSPCSGVGPYLARILP
ncbi:hypothetical protein D3C86_1963800 [compost metagenome]